MNELGMPGLQEYIRERASQVEAELRRVMPDEWSVPATLSEAMNYSLLAGGKRLRPIFVLAAAEAVEGAIDLVPAALPVACAIEMIHTYSLIHDDLPAMDDDDYRRGRLTNHKVYGEAMAILAGDGLLTHAFYSVVQAARRHGVPADRALAIVEELSAFAGPKGMVGGQAADMLGEQGLTKLEELEYIHLRKTSDLIVFSLRAGAIVGGASPKQLEELETFGRCIGLAFQIQDDVLDLIGDAAKLGKPVKSDEKQLKVTYPYFIGLDASKRRIAELTEQGKAALEAAELANPLRLQQLADFLVEREF
ncbi:polyprenyl synthetase family protein [Paenibacillus koleovorans]|uniref:polyprenyl synthetase family protein n=1 Tax=Paenibacillus koleovorans TaxID=121608 RepID=UPI000FD78712|nr:farnesyl diphosphate synthase [Paenibacillus koleovorans]